MGHSITSNLNFGKKLILAVAAFSVVAIPVATGLLHPATSAAQAQAAPAVFEFESVSLKPKGTLTGGPVTTLLLVNKGQFNAGNRSLKDLLAYAYRITDSQVSGGPEWMRSEIFDLQVKIQPTASGAEVRQAVQKVLDDRFKLALHHEMKQLPVLELSVSGNGLKLTEVRATDGEKPKMMIQPVGHWEANAAKIAALMQLLEMRTGRTVIDKTGLNGLYDFKLDTSRLAGVDPTTPEGLSALAQALSEQLGLQLTPTTALEEALVVDHAEKPASNE